MAMKYIKVMIDFLNHDKIEIIREDYADAPKHENPNDIIVSILSLWCRSKGSTEETDILPDTIRRIEKAAKWKGRRGKLVEILTNPEIRFIDVDDDGTHRLHNWYVHNKEQKPEAKEKVSDMKSSAANSRWLIEELGWLKKNKVSLDDCPWLFMNKEVNRVSVDRNKVPTYMYIADQEFVKRSHFLELFNNQSKDGQTFLYNRIKEFTKHCSKCGQLHVNQKYDICYDCQMKK